MRAEGTLGCGREVLNLVHSLQGPPSTVLLEAQSWGRQPRAEAICNPTSFWKRLSRLMSKVNPEPNVIHIMGCYILGNPNGEKVGTPDMEERWARPSACPSTSLCFSPPVESSRA